MAELALAGRTPLRFANYEGDMSHMLKEIHGPNEMKEYLVVVSVDYNFETNMSRVGFAFATTHDFEEAVKL